MRPSTRLICTDCLRSVDAPSQPDADESPRCRRCGGALEDHAASDDGPMADDEVGRFALESAAETEGPWEDRHVGGRDTSELRLLGHVGRFQLRELLGGGGFGLVYRAYDPRLDRDVALKVLNQTRPIPRHLERFFREARAAAQLDHPHIVPLHDAGRDGGRCWIAYQFVAGRSLSRICRERAVEIGEAARVIRVLADALDHAHHRGVCHRDVKPANVLIDEEGRPRLTDFGLARRLDISSGLTREGMIVGTPAYMSPEQAAGFGHLADARSDIYSLGVMLHEMLKGRRPADMPSGPPSWRVIRPTLALQPSRRHDRRVPRDLDRICRKALAVDPSDRYPSASDLADDLGRWLAARGRRPKVRATAVVVALGMGLAALDLAVHLAPSAPKAAGASDDAGPAGGPSTLAFRPGPAPGSPVDDAAPAPAADDLPLVAGMGRDAWIECRRPPMP